MGAPVGHQNAAKGARWKAAIEKALEEVSRARQAEAIVEAAKMLVEQALKGDMQALKELGDRLDGKPAQAITGPEGGPVQAVVTWRSENT